MTSRNQLLQTKWDILHNIFKDNNKFQISPQKKYQENNLDPEKII